MTRAVILATTGAVALCSGVMAQQPLSPSPFLAGNMPSGPVPGTVMTEAYAKMVASNAYLWAWPMVNLYNRRLAMAEVKSPVKAGPAILAPLNTLGVLTDYVDPGETIAAHPNQDVVYGFGMVALDLSPVVLQVPDFGDRFWVWGVYDTRTDNSVRLGKMYGSTPGFYLLVGPNWHGTVPKGITQVFRSTANSGLSAPRAFMEDTKADRIEIQKTLNQISMYPLSEYDGKMKTYDWSKLPVIPPQYSGTEEKQWVFPETFFDTLPLVLADAPPLPGEESRYAEILNLLAAAKDNPKLKEAMKQAAIETDAQVLTPLFEFRNFGIELPYHWRTMPNGAKFGTDYYLRASIAKSNIGVNLPNETTYFYQDFDVNAGRLNSANRYAITFPKGSTPPVRGFWSLSMYTNKHFFYINHLGRYSLGTKNKALKYNPDGSLTLYLQAEAPGGDKDSNWLPAPPNADFSVTIRAYWPTAATLTGEWTPPGIQKTN